MKVAFPLRWLAVLGLAMSAMSAHADVVDTSALTGISPPATFSLPDAIHATQLVWGTSLTVNAMSTAGAGTVSVSLNDLAWPAALSSLSFFITDNNQLFEHFDGAGTLSFDVTGPTQLFAAVVAHSGGIAGLYSLDVQFTAVPIPAAGLLLLSGVGGLGAFARRRRKR